MENTSPFSYAAGEVGRMFSKLTDTLELDALEKCEPRVMEIFLEASRLRTELATAVSSPEAEGVKQKLNELNTQLGMNDSEVIVSGKLYTQADNGELSSFRVDNTIMTYKGLAIFQAAHTAQAEIVHLLYKPSVVNKTGDITLITPVHHSNVVLDFCTMSAERSRAILANNFPNELAELETIAVKSNNAELALQACATHQLPEVMTLSQQLAFIQYAQQCIGHSPLLPHTLTYENIQTKQHETSVVEIKRLTIGHLHTASLQDKPIWHIEVTPSGLPESESTLRSLDLRYVRELQPYFPSKKPSLPIQNN